MLMGRTRHYFCSAVTVVQNRKLPSVIIVKCNVKGQLIEEPMVEWLREVWDGPCALLNKSGTGFYMLSGIR
jgi:hypothetical protein